jgi:hypothetical protein
VVLVGHFIFSRGASLLVCLGGFLEVGLVRALDCGSGGGKCGDRDANGRDGIFRRVWLVFGAGLLMCVGVGLLKNSHTDLNFPSKQRDLSRSLQVGDL